MARRGSGLGTVIKIAKAIDRDLERAARARERERKRVEREDARIARENERLMRQMERSEKAAEKAAIKEEIRDAKDSYELRCLERRALREEYVNMEIK